MTTISTKAELIDALQEARQRVIDWFVNIPTDDFYIRQDGEWSPSENVDHLLRSQKPITKALKLPKIVLQTMFGKAEKPSMSYETLCKIYVDTIAAGAQAPGQFLPNQENPSENAENKKKMLLDQLSKASADLIAAAEPWSDHELDEYLLPHPVIGKLTIREMLYFTIYHNLRHASLEGD